jgi:hypothetical protein
MAARGKKFPWEEKLLRSGYLVGAVLAHIVVFALLAGYVVFRAPPPEQPVEFIPKFNPQLEVTPPVHVPDAVAASGSAVSLDTAQVTGSVAWAFRAASRAPCHGEEHVAGAASGNQGLRRGSPSAR